MFIDSHLHFDSFVDEGDLSAVLSRAKEQQVDCMVAVGGSPEANRLAVELAQTHPGRVVATVGYDRDLAGAARDGLALARGLDSPETVAVGETGLDYHYGSGQERAQRELFAEMLEAARGAAKPVVVHSREADEDTLAMLSEHVRCWTGDAGRVGVLHCYTGGLAFALRLVDLGFYVSFSGILTFKNAAALREVAARLPLDRLLIETDAPYLAPVPHRGHRNEPAFVVEVARALAEIRDDSLDVIADSTSRNARHLFGLEQTSFDEK